MVDLHSPRVFHSLMVLSREPGTIWRLSAEKATESTSFSCPTKRRVVRPVLRSHRRRVPSQEPERVKWPCPRRAFLGYPYCPSSRVSCQTMTVLSREAERIMSGSSLVVAMEVTHPAWPSRVPRIAKLFCSEVMFDIYVRTEASH